MQLLAVRAQNIVFRCAGPVGIEPHVIADIAAAVRRVYEDAGTGILALVGTGDIAGIVQVGAVVERVPLHRGAHLVGAGETLVVQRPLLVGISGKHVVVHGSLKVDVPIPRLGAEELGQVKRRLHVVGQAHEATAGHEGVVLGLGQDGTQTACELLTALRIGLQILFQVGELDELVLLFHLIGAPQRAARIGIVLAEAQLLETVVARIVDHFVVVGILPLALFTVVVTIDVLVVVGIQPQKVGHVGELDRAGRLVLLVGADPQIDVHAVDEFDTALGHRVVGGGEAAHLDGVQILQPAGPAGVAAQPVGVLARVNLDVAVVGQDVIERDVVVHARAGIVGLGVDDGGLVAVVGTLRNASGAVGHVGGKLL